MHAYDAPNIGPREFLLAVLHDETVDPHLRHDAAVKLKQYNSLLNARMARSIRRGAEFPHRRPLDYQSRLRTKVRNSTPPPPPTITRDDWVYLIKHHEHARDTGTSMNTDVRRLRERVVIRNDVIQ